MSVPTVQRKKIHKGEQPRCKMYRIFLRPIGNPQICTIGVNLVNVLDYLALVPQHNSSEQQSYC